VRVDLGSSVNLNHQICFALYQANKEYNRLYATQLAQFEITYPQYLVLSTIWNSKQRLSMREISQTLELYSGTLTPMLKRLEKRGWLTRQKDPDDERHVLADLTIEAKAKMPAVISTVKDCIASLDLSQADYEQRVKEVNDITKRLKKIMNEM
jgi:DNA-binding MarR family transcriptional regulator